jgi:hypothetical protein
VHAPSPWNTALGREYRSAADAPRPPRARPHGDAVQRGHDEVVSLFSTELRPSAPLTMAAHSYPTYESGPDSAVPRRIYAWAAGDPVRLFDRPRGGACHCRLNLPPSSAAAHRLRHLHLHLLRRRVPTSRTLRYG